MEKGDDDLALLKRKLLAGEFRSMDEVVAWGRKRRGVGGETPEACVTAAAQGDVIPERVLKFLSSLPMSHSVHEWITTFRTILQEFLGDVDRISLSVNAVCDLVNPNALPHDISIAQSVNIDVRSVDQVSIDVDANVGQHARRFMDNLGKRDFPFAEYHEPLCREYVLYSHNYLGVAIFWRDCSKSPISTQTIELLDRLHSFMELLLSDFVARYQIAYPGRIAFNDIVIETTSLLDLSLQERRVMAFLLIGVSHDEIAAMLNISTNTVRYHLRSIYKKSGTHSQAEFFGKYFAPRIDPK